MAKTPTTEAGRRAFDHLDPAEAVRRAWMDRGANPEWHEKMKARVYLEMPARALDRLARGRER